MIAMVHAGNTTDSSCNLEGSQDKLYQRTFIFLETSFIFPSDVYDYKSVHQLSTFRKHPHSRSHKSFLTSWFRSLQLNFLSCAVIIVSILALQVTLTSSITSTPLLSSSSAPLPLNIGILVAEFCDADFALRIRTKVDQAISDFQTFVKFTDGDSNPTNIQVNCYTYPFCNTRSIVSNLDGIFGNSTVHAVLGLSTYDIHSSFIPLAEIYGKAYIPVNTFILTLARTQSVSFAPRFSQRGLMLAKVLDMYKWQNLYIIFTNYNFWLNFATYMYFEMTLFEYKVKLAPTITSPVSSEDAVRALQNVGNSKGRSLTPGPFDYKVDNSNES